MSHDISMYQMTVPQFIKILRQLDSILDKGAAFAASKKIDFDVLLHSRLAPDQFNLLRQIQIATDSAKLGVARVTTKAAPEHADTEKTLSDLKTRLQTTISYLETVQEKDFVGAVDRRITTPRWEGKTVSGAEYITQHTIPNFYFHVTTAYSILRHNGVEIGKKDYLGPMPFKA